MGEIVNLKRFRKQIARDQKDKDAQAQRARFGRTKAERKQDQEHKRMLDTVLDHHRLGEDQS